MQDKTSDIHMKDIINSIDKPQEQKNVINKTIFNHGGKTKNTTTQHKKSKT